MSILKTKKIQIGSHATASNNFVIEQPDTPDGTIRINRGNIGADTNIISFGEEIEINKTRLITTGMIRFGADVDSDVDRTLNTTVRDAYIRVQGGNLTNFGANIIMFGDQHETVSNRGRLRTSTSTIMEWSPDWVVSEKLFALPYANNIEECLQIANNHYVSEYNGGMVLYPNKASGAFRIRSHDNGTLFNTELSINSDGHVGLRSRLVLHGGTGNADRAISGNSNSGYTRYWGGTWGNGANLVLFGPNYSGFGSVGHLRSGSTTIAEWDDSEVKINGDLVLDASGTSDVLYINEGNDHFVSVQSSRLTEYANVNGSNDGWQVRTHSNRNSFATRIHVNGAGTWLNTASAYQSSANVVRDPEGLLRVASSTERVKTQIEDADLSLSYKVIEDSRPIWYRSKIKNDNPSHSYWGFLAEEVAELDPRLASYGYFPEDWESGEELEIGDIGEKLKPDATPKPIGVNYDRFVVHLVNVVKDQKKKIEDLTARIEKLEKTHYN